MVSETPDSDVYETSFDVGSPSPSVELAQAVASLKGVEADELTPLYNVVGSVVDDIFAQPLSVDGEFEFTFAYEGYQITLDNDGHASFRPL